MAKEHDVPFYAAGGIDTEMPIAENIEIEMRDADEVLQFRGQRIAPHGYDALYPAFDITPSRFVTAIITRHGVRTPPFELKAKA